MDNQETQLKHLCSICEESFATEEDYLAHVCEKTGFSPTDPQHLIASTTPNFADVSKAALERGAQEVTPAE